MPSNLSFQNQGALPKISPPSKKINTNPFGDTSGGILGIINKATGLSTPAPKPQPAQQSTPAPNMSTNQGAVYGGTNPGLLNVHKPSTPVKSITDTTGNTINFHAPEKTATTPTQTKPTTPETPKAPQVGNQMQNAQNVLDVSSLNNNPQYQALAQQNSLLTQAQNNVSTAGLAGSENTVNQAGTDLLGTKYSDLFRPQATANLQGEKGILNPYLVNAMAGNTAEANRLLQGAQLGTQGATSVLSAGAPQFNVGFGTQVGNPLAPNGGINTGAYGGVAAPANIKSIQDYTTQINTTQKSIDTLKGLGATIAPNMGTVGFNPTSSPIGNQTFAQYFTEKNPAAKAGLVAGLGEIKNQISNVIASATGLTPTGVTAVTDQYDLTTLNPQQLNDFLLYIDKYAQINMDAANKSIARITAGGSADANTGVLPVPPPNSTGQAALGTGANAAKGLITNILNQAGNAVTGGVAGFAAKVLR